jgi:hypothetical protein
MSELYLPNEVVELIYKQSIWLLIGDKKRLFKDIHQSIKNKYREKKVLEISQNIILSARNYDFLFAGGGMANLTYSN